MTSDSGPTRRRVLRAAGAGLTVPLVAGCASPSDGGGGNGGDTTTTGDGMDTTTPGDGTTTPGDGTTTPGDGTTTDGGGGVSPDDYPAVEEWLTGTEVGAADDTYDGTIVDRRGRDVVNVDVGAEGNDGYYAFGPSAVAVSRGTTVEWVWTGRGQLHNVVADPDAQIGESDYAFSSGEPVADEGTTFTQDLGQAGVALYHCEPHLALGMKGAVVVVE